MVYWGSTYQTRGRNPGRALLAKQKFCNTDYARKADEADRNFCENDPADCPGPVRRYLETFGRVRGFAGSEHDISPDFKWLLDFLAGKAAEKRWREMGARSVMEVKTVFRTSYRRQIGIALAR